LCLTLTCAFMGCLTNIRYGIGGPFTGLLCVGMIFALAFHSNKKDYVTRISMLSVFGFLKGLSLGPLINRALVLDPTIVVSAFFITSMIFLCFTLSALLAKSRSYFAMGSLLSSSITFLLCLNVLSWFWPSVW